MPENALRATVELGGGDAVDVWVPNTYEHEQALIRLMDALDGGYIEHTNFPILTKEVS